MPIQSGGFATGLAQGLFGELASQRQAKEQRNSEDKQQTLKLLTGLLERAEPESQPALLRHIGDVMGLKGNQQGIWARLTGADLESDSGALHSKLQDILGHVSGPAPTRPQLTTQGTAPIPGLGGAFPNITPTGQRTRATDQMDPNQIYLRDPQGFELEKIGLRAQFQNQLAGQRIAEQQGAIYSRQSRLQEDRQTFDKEQVTTKAMQAAMGPIYKQAAVLARGEPLTDDHLSRAADMVGEKMGLDKELLKANIGLKGAQAKLAEFQATTDPSTGLPMGKAPTLQQNREFELQKQKQALDAGHRYDTARSKAKALGEQLQSMYALIDSQGYSYDADTGKLYNKTSKQEVKPGAMGFQSSMLKLPQLNALAKQKSQAMAEMEGVRQEIGTNFSDYYDVGGQVWDVRPKARPAANGPVTYDATTPKGAPPPPPGKKIPDMGQTSNWTSSNDYKVGETITVGQMQFKVLQVLGSNGIDHSYQIRRIR